MSSFERPTPPCSRHVLRPILASKPLPRPSFGPNLAQKANPPHALEPRTGPAQEDGSEVIDLLTHTRRTSAAGLLLGERDGSEDHLALFLAPPRSAWLLDTHRKPPLHLENAKKKRSQAGGEYIMTICRDYHKEDRNNTESSKNHKYARICQIQEPDPNGRPPSLWPGASSQGAPAAQAPRR